MHSSSSYLYSKLRRNYFLGFVFHNRTLIKEKYKPWGHLALVLRCLLPQGWPKARPGDFLPSEDLGLCFPPYTLVAHTTSLPSNFDTILMCPAASNVSRLHPPSQKMLFFFSPSRPVGYCSWLQKGHSAEVFSGSPLWTRRASAGIQGWKICVSGTRPRHHGKGNGKPRGKTTGRWGTIREEPLWQRESSPSPVPCCPGWSFPLRWFITSRLVQCVLRWQQPLKSALCWCPSCQSTPVPPSTSSRCFFLMLHWRKEFNNIQLWRLRKESRVRGVRVQAKDQVYRCAELSTAQTWTPASSSRTGRADIAGPVWKITPPPACSLSLTPSLLHILMWLRNSPLVCLPLIVPVALASLQSFSLPPSLPPLLPPSPYFSFSVCMCVVYFLSFFCFFILVWLYWCYIWKILQLKKLSVTTNMQ